MIDKQCCISKSYENSNFSGRNGVYSICEFGANGSLLQNLEQEAKHLTNVYFLFAFVNVRKTHVFERANRKLP